MDLQGVEAQQIVDINDLPQPKPVSEGFDDVANIITEANAGKTVKPDTTMTGSIDKPKAAAKPAKRIVPNAVPKGAGLY